MKKILILLSLFVTLKSFAQDVIVKDTSWTTPRRTSATGGINVSGVFQPMLGYRITNVTFTCTNVNGESGCGWNYNPNGGYGGNITISADGSATWRRRYDGAPCKQTYTITYKKVTIDPFWKDKLTFITDTEYNPDSKVFLKNSASIPVKLRYKVEYSIGGAVQTSYPTISVLPFSNTYVGAKYIRSKDGIFLINYEIFEVPAP